MRSVPLGMPAEGVPGRDASDGQQTHRVRGLTESEATSWPASVWADAPDQDDPPAPLPRPPGTADPTAVPSACDRGLTESDNPGL